jgi:hypothetical protein
MNYARLKHTTNWLSKWKISTRSLPNSRKDEERIFLAAT